MELVRLNPSCRSRRQGDSVGLVIIPVDREKNTWKRLGIYDVTRLYLRDDEYIATGERKDMKRMKLLLV
jgi:hypothetical protein